MNYYIAELRLERAASLLIEEPNLTITQVAQACGFSTLRYFTDRFKHRFGMTPTDFRKAKRSFFQRRQLRSNCTRQKTIRNTISVSCKSISAT